MNYEVTIPESDAAAAVADTAPTSETWHIAKVDAAYAHNRRFDGRGQTIAILDTGCDINHPALNGRISHGPNYTEDSTSSDENGHGTHVAGLCAIMAPMAKLISVKVLNRNNGGTWRSITQGVDWCIANSVTHINMSLGGPQWPTTAQDAVERALSAGITICAASGNTPAMRPFYPASHVGVVSVAACDENNQLWVIANTYDVDIIAPGVNVYSTLPHGEYGFLSGTSMASPVACGLLACADSGGVSVERVIGRAVEQQSDAQIITGLRVCGVVESVWLPTFWS